MIVGGQAFSARDWFESCETVDELDNGVGVDNEEQGMPILVCTDRWNRGATCGRGSGTSTDATP